MKKFFYFIFMMTACVLFLSGCGEVQLKSEELLGKWYLNDNEYIRFLDDNIVLQKGITNESTGEICYSAILWKNQNNGTVKLYFTGAGGITCPIKENHVNDTDSKKLYIDVNSYKFYKEKVIEHPLENAIEGKWKSSISDGYFLFLEDGTLVNKITSKVTSDEYYLELYAGTWNEVGNRYFISVFDVNGDPQEIILEWNEDKLVYNGKDAFTLTKIE